MSERAAVDAALVDAHRREWAFVLAATVRVVRDLDLAEECVQEAYAAALRSWPTDGIPHHPAAWLTTAARRRGVDAVRRDRTLRSKLPLLVDPDQDDGASQDRAVPGASAEERVTVPDERLRLVFLCCHPALDPQAQAALTLRLVCGVSTQDVARVFLVSEATMAARITRAKKKIAGSRIPYRVPPPQELAERLQGVLSVIHLLFTTGHTAMSGAELVRRDLVKRSLQLARTLRELLPGQAEADGLLALLLLTDARRSTRTSTTGRLLTLEEQDRSTWDRTAIAEARDLLLAAVGHGAPGRYALQAAIALVHCEAATFEATDWLMALALYDRLLEVLPSPVVALNRTVPLSRVAGPAAALAEVEALEDDARLAGYHYLPAIKADLLTRVGRPREAALAYQRALELTDNDAERHFLEAKRDRTAPETS